MHNALLLLSDGTFFPGKSFGTPPPPLKDGDLSTAGEVVFNTSMSGYHEILTDPSYRGQMVTFTSVNIGNYGCDHSWNETGTGESETERLRPKACSLVVRNLYEGALPMGRISLDHWLKEYGLSGITGVDTRALTLHLRQHGSCNGMLLPIDGAKGAGSDKDWMEQALALLHSLPSMEGRPLSRDVGCRRAFTFGPHGKGKRKNGRPLIAVVDYGVKRGILRELTEQGAAVEVVPSSWSSADILALKPEGVLLSNGPGDPGVLEREIEVVGQLIGKVPVFGICLGHQLLALSLGGKTSKMAFGHHGGNHPVREEESGRVFVTSQNHGFEVDANSLPGELEVSYRNANDGSVEGLRHRRLPVCSVQFHPEASPGPREARVLFDRWLTSL
jgi:carbamoyl-phosphate synthase small subunit